MIVYLYINNTELACFCLLINRLLCSRHEVIFIIMRSFIALSDINIKRPRCFEAYIAFAQRSQRSHK